MALELARDTAFGVTANYWRIGRVEASHADGWIVITLYGYPSRDAREGGAQPLNRVDVTQEMTPDISDSGRAGLYAALKLLPAWADATDVFETPEDA